MIVADASWIIALRDPANTHHRSAATIVDTVADDERWLHTVTFAECLIGPARAGQLEPAAAALRAAFEIVDVDFEAPLRWARLRADTGLRLPDSIVLDTALVNGATAVVTFDQQLAHEVRRRGLAVLGLRLGR